MRGGQAKGARKVAKAAKIRPPGDNEAKAVVLWFHKHFNTAAADLSRITGLDYHFCHRWTSRAEEGTLERPLKKRGPSFVIPDEELSPLKRAVLKRRFASATKTAAQVINPRTKKPIAGTTLQRNLKERAGLCSVKVRRTCFLTLAHREHRLWFVDLYPHEDWTRWIWSDEKWFMIGGIKGNERMWVEMCDPDPEERYVGKVAHPTKVMVWGAISYWGKSTLHFFDGKIASDQYQACIAEALLPAAFDPEFLAVPKTKRVVFQQDGARVHTSNSTEKFLEDNLPSHWTFTPKGGWCPNSPDLSIIETVWAVLQDKVIERLAFTEEELCEVLLEEWWALDQQRIQKLHDQIPFRMQACKAANGGRFSNAKFTAMQLLKS